MQNIETDKVSKSKMQENTNKGDLCEPIHFNGLGFIRETNKVGIFSLRHHAYFSVNLDPILIKPET